MVHRVLVAVLLAALVGHVPVGLGAVIAAVAPPSAVDATAETPVRLPADPASTSTDPPAPTDRAWRAARVVVAPDTGAALRPTAGTHPAGGRPITSGPSPDPDPRSRQHISPLTVVLQI